MQVRVDECDGRGATALHEAAKWGHHAVRRGSSRHFQPNTRPRCSLGQPCDTHPQVVDLLLRAGADADAADADGRTPLCVAAAVGHARVVRRRLLATPRCPRTRHTWPC
jgi:ankyrin repeat protein